MTTECRDVPDEAYFDGRVAAESVRALRELNALGQPFFLAVGFWKPHSPFNAPKRYWDLYERSCIPLPANPQPPRDVPAIALHNFLSFLRSFPNAVMMRKVDHKRQKIQEDPVVLAG